MFVGESGVARTIQRTVEAMDQAGLHDPREAEAARRLGVIDLPTLQRYLNFHFSVTLDLFGAETSTNAATAFNAGIKGRYHESKIDDDHQLLNATYPVLVLREGRFETVDEPALNALNARLRDDFIHDCAQGVKRWNKVIEKSGVEFELALPHQAFNRQIGQFSEVSVTPAGEIVDAGSWAAQQEQWLPTRADREYVASLMQPCYESGRYAGWIAAPKVGINRQPGDFEYVRIAG